MLTYIKKKYYENKVKLMFYKAIYQALKENQEIINLCNKLFVALKDVPVDELKGELISAIADLANKEVHGE